MIESLIQVVEFTRLNSIPEGREGPKLKRGQLNGKRQYILEK